MLVITVARKPLDGTVARTVLAWGTGGLNIDACRISTSGEEIHAPQSDPALRKGVVGQDLGISRASAEKMHQAQRESILRTQTLGRWPANLILSHLDGCRLTGKSRVKGNRVDTRPDGDGGRADKSQWRFRPTEATKRGYSAEDGTETVETWDCQSGCPVNGLDSTVGVLKSGQVKVEHQRKATPGFNWSGKTVSPMPLSGYGDTGGASRFFKQVGGSRES